MTDPGLAKRLNDLIRGYWTTQALYVAAELDIAGRLRDGPKTPAVLAEECGARAGELYRLLRALASIDVFEEDDQGRFGLTPLGEALAGPGGQGYALLHGAELYATWGNMLHMVRTGAPAFEHTHGMKLFEYMATHRERGAVFDRAMFGHHGAETAPMLDAYDFSGFREVTDVGGGDGSALITMLQRHPHLKGVLFDLPEVVERARDNLEAAGLTDRCRVVGGDFFGEIPAGSDAYVIRHCVHDWGDDDTVRILRNCREAAAPHGRVLVVEMVIPAGNEPFFGKWLDLMMMCYGGKERTEAEYRRLYERAGLELVRVVPTSMAISVVEGVCRN